jgi:hypothetical protein
VTRLLRRIPLLAPALLWFGIALAAQAHSATATRSDIVLHGEVVVFRIAVAAHDLAAALGIDPVLAAPIDRQDFDDRRATLDAYFQDGLRIASEAGPCPPFSVTPDYRAMPDLIATVVAFRCAAPPRHLSVEFGLFFEFDPAHRNMGDVALGDGRIEFVFDAENRRLEFDTTPEARPRQPDDQSSWERFASILTLGIEHIASSPNQILFLLVVLMTRPRFRSALAIVTAFALAHAAAMEMNRYGLAVPPMRAIDLVIATAVALVALQNLLGRGADRRWVAALGFGLLHGLGLFPAIPGLHFGDTDPTAFFLAFNFGVWLGQLPLAVAACALLSRWHARGWYPNFVRAASLLVLIVAGYWIVERGIAG